MDRALGFEPRGWGFESLRVRHSFRRVTVGLDHWMWSIVVASVKTSAAEQKRIAVEKFEKVRAEGIVPDTDQMDLAIPQVRCRLDEQTTGLFPSKSAPCATRSRYSVTTRSVGLFWDTGRCAIRSKRDHD